MPFKMSVIGEWKGHDNSAFNPGEESSPTPKKPSLKRPYCRQLSSESATSGPVVTRHQRTTSESESITSKDSRMYGRPLSLPVVPKIDYPIPRASMPEGIKYARGVTMVPRSAETYGDERKLLRTASGRRMRAFEYLRGHQQSEEPLRE